MEFLAGREFSREEIDRVFGVPAGYWAKEATRANSEAAEAGLIRNAVWPMLNWLHDELTAQCLQPRYGEGLVARFEDIRPRDRDLQLREQAAAENTRTLNEARLARGEREYVGPMADTIAELPVPLATNAQFVLAVSGLGAPMGMGGTGMMAVSRAALDDLEKWRRVALRRIEDGNDPGAYEFVSDYIPAGTLEQVKAALVGVADRAGVEAVFDGAIGNGKGGTAADAAPFRLADAWGDYP